MSNSWTFRVADVEIRKDAGFLKTVSIASAGRKLANLWKEENPDCCSLEFEAGSTNYPTLVNTGIPHNHGFINAILTAYLNHLPLILSPDDFWLLICQAVNQFENRFLNHKRAEAKGITEERKISIRGDSFGILPKRAKSNLTGWPEFVEDCCFRVQQETTKRDLVKIMMGAPFSTTGSQERAAFGLSLMDSLKTRMDFKCLVGCGIPLITVEGTERDFRNILDRILGLKKLMPDFEQYLDTIEEHIEEIIKTLLTSDSSESSILWKSMICRPSAFKNFSNTYKANQKFNGWLSDFLAYKVTFPDENGLILEEKKGRNFTFGDCNYSAVAFADIKLEDAVYTGKDYQIKLAGGFMGVSIVEQNGSPAIRPAIGWASYYGDEENSY